ncbi:MAG: PRC-barrel domain-containing protein [Planctomycetota bacterium]|nr:PRC-barrel domain-containing protein [Planctomycetota bacterium]
MKIQQPLLAAAVMALGSQAFAQSAAPVARDAGSTYVLAPSAKIIGLNVHNEADKSLGEIGDVLIDPRSGELRYAIIDVGGFLGMGEDHRVIPWAYVHVMQDEKDAAKCHARTNLTEAQVKASPACKKDQVFDADLDKRVESAFGKNDMWAFNGDGKPMFARLSELDGVNVKDPAGKEIGSVQDLIIAPQNGCIAYAIVDTKKEAGDKDVALPFSRLNYAFDADKKLMATTTVEIARFQSAPEYDKKDWKRMSSTPWLTEVSTYYSADPFWKTTRFASAHRLPKQSP